MRALYCSSIYFGSLTFKEKTSCLESYNEEISGKVVIDLFLYDQGFSRDFN